MKKNLSSYLLVSLLLALSACETKQEKAPGLSEDAKYVHPDLLGDSTLNKLNDKYMQRAKSGEPVHPDIFDNFDAVFQNRFRSGNINAGKAFPELRINWASVAPYLKLKNPGSINLNDTDTVVMMHYVLIGNNSMGIGLTLGLKNNLNNSLGIYMNGTLNATQAILVGTNGDMINTIPITTLMNYKQLFKDSIKVSFDTAVAPVFISEWEGHPTLCATPRLKLEQLYAHNMNDAGEYDGTPYLGFSWGAGVTKAPFGTMHYTRCFNLIPMVYLVKNGLASHRRPSPGNQDTNEAFDKRALDVGKLCPPDCD